MSKIIGLVGAKGAGKTTAYKLISELISNTQEITIAGKLKDVCAETFSIPRDHFDSHLFKEKDLKSPVYLTKQLIESLILAYDIQPNYDKHVRAHIGKVLISPRKVAQYVGTEILRTIDEDLHCKACIKDIKPSEDSLIVVTDIRFPNEFVFFANNATNFYPIYIKNTSAEAHSKSDGHYSESFLPQLASKASKVDNENSLADFKDNLTKTLINIGVLK